MKAYEILANPESWTKGSYARNAEGKTCNPKEGVSFCVVGALFKKWEDKDDPIDTPLFLRDQCRLREYLQKNDLTKDSVSYWNDTKATHEDVIRILKELDI
jgi:hypothetical protein